MPRAISCIPDNGGRLSDSIRAPAAVDRTENDFATQLHIDAPLIPVGAKFMNAGSNPFPRHLLQIEGLRRDAILSLVRSAASFAGEGDPASRTRLAGRRLVNLFFENSTRTRTSFETAARRLGADVLNFDLASSSVKKGESLLDTVRTIDAMRPDFIAIRHASAGAAAFIAEHTGAGVINAGDGAHEHPTQALLDAFTITQRLGRVEGRRIAIVGDVLHSRVARSSIWCLGTLGASITLGGPRAFLPEGFAGFGGHDVRVAHELGAAIEGADVVILLRIQLERMQKGLFPSLGEYHRLYGLTSERLAKYSPTAFVMHPGPFNRGVEISGELADSDRSLILTQVANGVPTRMAVLAALDDARRARS
jgi:aspartate carbamoyltransferase catalytic subunit